MDQKCETCCYFVDGKCRRYPPKYIMSQGFVNYENPIVEATNWCGEYKKKDTTLLLRE